MLSFLQSCNGFQALQNKSLLVGFIQIPLNQKLVIPRKEWEKLWGRLLLPYSLVDLQQRSWPFDCWCLLCCSACHVCCVSLQFLRCIAYPIWQVSLYYYLGFVVLDKISCKHSSSLVCLISNRCEVMVFIFKILTGVFKFGAPRTLWYPLMSEPSSEAVGAFCH